MQLTTEPQLARSPMPIAPPPPYLVLLKVVTHHRKAPGAQQIAVHQLLAGIEVGAQPDAQQCQVASGGQEVACRSMRARKGRCAATTDGHVQKPLCRRASAQSCKPSLFRTSFQVPRRIYVANHWQACITPTWWCEQDGRTGRSHCNRHWNGHCNTHAITPALTPKPAPAPT